MIVEIIKRTGIIVKTEKDKFLDFIKEKIIEGRKDGFDKIIIEDENESEGLKLCLFFVKDNTGTGKVINQFRDAFYDVKRGDLNKIKSEFSLNKIKFSHKHDFGEYVKTIAIEF
jgi:hypothetical protein